MSMAPRIDSTVVKITEDLDEKMVSIRSHLLATGSSEIEANRMIHSAIDGLRRNKSSYVRKETPSIKILVCYEIPCDGGTRALTGDDYHVVSGLTEMDLERVRAVIEEREKKTYGERITGRCLFCSVTALKG